MKDKQLSPTVGLGDGLEFGKRQPGTND